MEYNKDEFYTFRGYQILDREEHVLTPSMEDYMEMIYRTCIKNGYTRIHVIADKLNVKSSSATKVIQKLSGYGLVNYRKYGAIRLTNEGNKVGKYLVQRHNTIEKFLRLIGVSEEAFMTAEKIEHHLSNSIVKRLDLMTEFFNAYPELLLKLKQYYKDRNIKDE